MTERSLIEVLSAFDAAALGTIASKGLVRRAVRDVEHDLVDILELGSGGAVVQADGEEVQVDAKGPAAAQCTCPAVGICRHILAAVLVLQSHGRDGTDPTAEPEAEAAATDGDQDPLSEICALTNTEIEKWAGKAAMRAARELLSETAVSDISIAGTAVVITIAPDLPEVRFLSGLGLDGMVSKFTKAKTKAHHAAAILAVRRSAGLHTPSPESDDTGPSFALTKPDSEFLRSVRRCLTDCVRTGFNKAPLVLEERLFALSVATRADALPRLSRLLRTISAMVRAKRSRSHSLDPERHLALVAEAFILARALDTDGIADEPSRLAALAGLVQQDYAPVGDLQLFGVGAQIWQTAAGGRGVTGHFYESGRDAWYSGSLARGSGQDPGFAPKNAYRSAAMWGAGPLETLCRSQLRLSGALASDDGRLSMAKSVSGVCQDWPSPAEVIKAWPSCFMNWQKLQAHLHGRFAPALTTPRNTPGPIILAPARSAPAYFDELQQQSVWPLCDDEGSWIGLTIPHSDATAEAIGHLEELTRSRTISATAALAIPEQRRFVLTPFSVWPDRGARSPVNLGLETDAIALGDPGASAQRIKGFLRKAAAATGLGAAGFVFEPSDGVTERSLREAFDACLGVAELGRSEIDPETRLNIQALARKCDRQGLPSCADVLQQLTASDASALWEAVLSATYVLSRTQAMLRPLPRLTNTRDT